MPAAIKYVPPTDKERDDYSLELLSERAAREARYAKALKYYDGLHPEQVEYDPDVEPNDNTVINLVKVTADRTAMFLFPSIPKFQTDPDAIEETPEELWIRKLIEANGGLEFLVKIALRGFLAGNSFVRVKPGKKYGKRQTLPQLVLLDPLTVTVYWNADDVGDVLWYEVRYRAGKELRVQDFVWRPEKGEAGEWEIYTYRSKQEIANEVLANGTSPHGAGSLPRTNSILYASGQQYELVPTEEGADFARHTSPFPPIIEFGHLPHPDDRYGHGEVNQTNLQDTINRVWSEINRIVRKHSDPVDVIVGADVNDVELGEDIMTITQPEAKVQRLEMRGDLTAAVATVEKLVKTYLAVARVVLLEGEAKDLQRVTNASVRTLFIDALAKNAILQHSYGNALVRMVKLAMQMSGEIFAPKALDMDVTCRWAEALPVDKNEIANINAIMVGLGARSKRTAATEIGDSWAFEQAAIETETDVALEHAVATAKAMAEAAPQPEQQPPGQQKQGGGGNKPLSKKPADSQ